MARTSGWTEIRFSYAVVFRRRRAAFERLGKDGEVDACESTDASGLEGAFVAR